MHEDLWKTVGSAIGGGGVVAVVTAFLKWNLSRGTQLAGSRRTDISAHAQILDRQERQIQQLEKRHDECMEHHQECLEHNAQVQAELGVLRERVARLDTGSRGAIGLVMANEDGIITSWNQGAMGLFHWTADEAIGQPLTILMPERFRARYQKSFNRLVAAKQAPVALRDIMLPGLTREGDEVDITVRLSAWDGANGWTYAGEVSRRI